jgi:serine phosphatase RsbU (regulator of sigma subunit)
MENLTPQQHVPKMHSISRHFSYAFISVVTLILVMFAIIAIFVNRARIDKELMNRLDNALNIAKIALRVPLWDIDTKSSSNFISSLLLDEAIIYARVIWQGRVIIPPIVDKNYEHNDLSYFEKSAQFVVKNTDIFFEENNVGTLQLVMSRARTQQEIFVNILGIIGLTVLIIIAISLTSIVITRRYISRPLLQLQRSATLIANGNLEATIETSGAGEIGYLAQNLNAMRESIKQLFGALRTSNDQLEEANRTLEQRVAERTEQLAQANAAVTALNAQLQTDNLRMSAELNVTRKLQYMLLPTSEELHQIVDLDIACYMEPADEVGGDYYDVLQHNGQIKIGIGDVTGHGLESGVLMVMTQAIVRALLASGETDPVRFLAALNYALYGNVQRMGTDKNLTLALLDYTAGDLRLSGQHETMLVVRNDGTVEVVDTIDLGFPVALTDEIADFIHHTTVHLQPGDGVVLYTDGITEAENLTGEQYGLERLCTLASQCWAAPAEVIKERVVTDVRQHMGAQTMYDDITLVVAKRR